MSTPYNISVRVDPAGAQQGGRQVESALDRIEQRMRRIQGLAGGLFAVAALQRLARELVQTADAYTQLQNRLRVVTTDSAQLAVIQQELFDISQRTRTEFAANVEMYARLNLATKDLGVSARDLLNFQESLNQAIALSGTSAQEARSGIFQLSQAMSKGRLDGDELRSVLENIPVVADVIAKSLNITRGELRKFGEEGKLTGDVILKAFKEAREEMSDRFSKTTPTVGQAMTQVGNSFTNFVGRIDELTGATRILVSVLQWLSKTLDDASRGLDKVQENIYRSKLDNIAQARGVLEGSAKRKGYWDQSDWDALRDFDDERRRIQSELDRLLEDRGTREAAQAAARAGLELPGQRGNIPPTPLEEKKIELIRRTAEELDKENNALLLNAQEREVVVRLLEIEEKFRRQKTPLTEAETEAVESRIRALQQLKMHVEIAANAFQSLFKGMEDSLVSFATTGRFEFKRFADAVVADLIRIALQAYVTRPLLNFATGVANPALASLVGPQVQMGTSANGGWTTAVSGANLFGFANGGEFQVGGHGGTDSQLVAFRASPDETVRVTRPGQEIAKGGGNMTVIVNNNASNTEVQQRESTGPDGSAVLEVFINSVKREIGDGAFDGVLGSRFGSSPTKKRR